jgi:hypothetical protein
MIAALMEMVDDRSLGLDGFLWELYKASQDIVASNLLEVHKEAIQKQTLSASINHGLIIFIPKPSNPKLQINWRSITLVSYKILAKALEFRLKHTLAKIVGLEQT